MKGPLRDLSMGTGDPPSELAARRPEFSGFEVLEELGRSPRGIVYKARRKIERDPVVLKVLRSSACDPQYLVQLAANAEASFFLAHKGLVRTLGCMLLDDTPVLVSEFASGTSLAQLLGSGHALDAARALRVALECADALRHAASHGRHHGRLHPADVIVGETRTRILGVGLGERHGPSPAAPYAFSPLLYAAPEALPNQPPTTTPDAKRAADVYSLGAILLHALTGHPPPAATDPSPETARVSPVLQTLLGRMLSPDPAARPDYEALVASLDTALQDFETPAPQIQHRPAAESEHGVPDVKLEPVNRPPVQRVPFTTALPANATPAQVTPPNDTPRAPQRRILLAGGLAVAALIPAAILAMWIARPRNRSADRSEVADGTPARLQEPASAAPSERTALPPADKASPITEQPAAAEPPPATEPARQDEEYALATRQLDALQDLLQRGDLKCTPALLKAVRIVEEKAGRNTPTGVRARKFSIEIERQLVKQAKN